MFLLGILSAPVFFLVSPLRQVDEACRRACQASYLPQIVLRYASEMAFDLPQQFTSRRDFQKDCQPATAMLAVSHESSALRLDSNSHAKNSKTIRSASAPWDDAAWRGAPDPARSNAQCESRASRQELSVAALTSTAADASCRQREGAGDPRSPCRSPCPQALTNIRRRTSLAAAPEPCEADSRVRRATV